MYNNRPSEFNKLDMDLECVLTVNKGAIRDTKISVKPTSPGFMSSYSSNRENGGLFAKFTYVSSVEEESNITVTYSYIDTLDEAKGVQTFTDTVYTKVVPAIPKATVKLTQDMIAFSEPLETMNVTLEEVKGKLGTSEIYSLHGKLSDYDKYLSVKKIEDKKYELTLLQLPDEPMRIELYIMFKDVNYPNKDVRVDFHVDLPANMQI